MLLHSQNENRNNLDVLLLYTVYFLLSGVTPVAAGATRLPQAGYHTVATVVPLPASATRRL